ncbi:MAG: phage virion morphogenesis protein [Deltaproteobacteria bacterium]|nr:phage virion morphogenesis protein [Deltaproteobacteria bacterium]
MAGLIEIEIDDREIREALSRLAAKVRNLAPAMKNIGEYLQRSTWERFAQQKDPSGKPWAPLKPSTLARKKTSKILIESSRLRDSIVYRADSDQVEVGTNVEYAAIHQFGGTVQHQARNQNVHFAKKGNRVRFAKSRNATYGMKVSIGAHATTIPARPFLGVSDEDRSEILDIIRDHVHSGGK